MTSAFRRNGVVKDYHSKGVSRRSESEFFIHLV